MQTYIDTCNAENKINLYRNTNLISDRLYEHRKKNEENKNLKSIKKKRERKNEKKLSIELLIIIKKKIHLSFCLFLPWKEK